MLYDYFFERIAQGDAHISFRTRIARQVTFGKQRYRLALELHVIDNGPGVPDSIKDRIFYPLVSGRADGTGLGLTAATVIMEEINRSGGNAGAVHGQMYNMGTLLRSGSAEQKRKYLPAIAAGKHQEYGLKKQVSGVRGNRSVKKKDMVLNNYMPTMEIDAQTYQVRADGQLLVCEPATELPMAQKYFLF